MYLYVLIFHVYIITGIWGDGHLILIMLKFIRTFHIINIIWIFFVLYIYLLYIVFWLYLHWILIFFFFLRFSEHVDIEEAKSLFETNYSHVYYVLYDTFIQADANLRQRGTIEIFIIFRWINILQPIINDKYIY